MSTRILTETKRKATLDLIIILGTSALVMGILFFLMEYVNALASDQNISILLRTLASAAVEYGVLGLGSTIVILYRKEKWKSYGLQSKGLFLTILLSILCFIPNFFSMLYYNEVQGYLPFQGVHVTKEVLASGFPVNLLGMAIIATSWGFFEGFNYVVMSDKINQLFPSKNKWLNWGAIFCAIFCILIHGAAGLSPKSIFDMISTIIVIYGMLMVREFTGNAWGCVFIYLFLWNAF
jgi:heme/copper-type cytochrome/quinol oxidase subunit 2